MTTVAQRAHADDQSASEKHKSDPIFDFPGQVDIVIRYCILILKETQICIHGFQVLL